MLKLADAYSREELIISLDGVHREVAKNFQSLSADELFRRPAILTNPQTPLRTVGPTGGG